MRRKCCCLVMTRRITSQRPTLSMLRCPTASRSIATADGSRWSLTEEPLELCDALRRADRHNKAVLVDCLTLWLSNLMHSERDITRETDRLIELLPALNATIVFVSNEVGLGIVPENRLARQFRDHQGVLNRKLAACVDRVDFIAAGLPLTLKS